MYEGGVVKFLVGLGNTIPSPAALNRNQGTPQTSSGPGGDTMTMTSATGTFKVILRTMAITGETRYTTAEF
jgi:hypothetical protein